MALQAAHTGKLLAAVRTLTHLFPCVYTHVRLQILRAGESVLTVFTGMWSVGFMSPHVLLQRIHSVETLAALLAFKGAVVRVAYHVPAQMARVDECLSTLLTLVRLIAIVDKIVSSQVTV